MHYFCTVALRTPYARVVLGALMRAYSFDFRVIVFLKLNKMSNSSHIKTKKFVYVVYELD